MPNCFFLNHQFFSRTNSKAPNCSFHVLINRMKPIFLRSVSTAGACSPIIGATCAFDAKIYKKTGEVFAASVLSIWNKKFLAFFIFVFNFHRIWSKSRPNLSYFNKIFPWRLSAGFFQFCRPAKTTSRGLTGLVEKRPQCVFIRLLC